MCIQKLPDSPGGPEMPGLLGSAIIKVETSLLIGCPSPETKDLHAELVSNKSLLSNNLMNMIAVTF